MSAAATLATMEETVSTATISTRVSVWRATPVSTVRQVSVTVYVSLYGGYTGVNCETSTCYSTLATVWRLHRCQLLDT